MVNRYNRRRCSICGEWATHRCHVYDKELFRSQFCEWPDRDDEDQNIIYLCQTHHGVYFDKHHGNRNAACHMIIDLNRNSLFIIDPMIRNPTIEDIEEFRYFEEFDLLPEYVDYKNSKCIDVLYSGWLELTGQFDEWI